MTKRVAIACGGTGGHFYPGYVLARTLRSRGWETLFLLRTQDPAAALLSREGLPFVELNLRGMPRGLTLEWPGFFWQVGSSLHLMRNVLRAYRPRCVVGMGGYLTFPAAVAARFSGVPSLLHESNSIFGLANRACLPFVSRVALGLPLARTPGWPKRPYDLTGTPVREPLLSLPPAAKSRERFGLDPKAPTVLVFGGSQGARGINRAAPEALRSAALRVPGLQCLHLSGPKEESQVRSSYDGSPLKSVVLGYTQEMDAAYAAADLVVCRSGASTLAELIAVRKPAILVPYPHAAANHQEANARLLEKAGAARCLLERGLDGSVLAAAIGDLISSGLTTMKDAYGRLELPPCAEAPRALADAVERTAA